MQVQTIPTPSQTSSEREHAEPCALETVSHNGDAAFLSSVAMSVDAWFVDLDGTLIAGDLFWDSLPGAIKSNPKLLFKIPSAMIGGRAAVKRLLSQQVQLGVNELPLRQEVVELVRSARLGVGRIVLATASDQLLADEVAQHTGLFDDVLASDGNRNLKGQEKLAAIEAYCKAHGISSWTYVGDSYADLAIWNRAACAGVVAPSKGLLKKIAATTTPFWVVAERTSVIAAAVKCMRPQQWVKNLLVFAPLFLAHELWSPAKMAAALVAFAAFCACASAAYVLNDLFDLEADRQHPIKRHRPLASGALSAAYAPLLAAGLFSGGAMLAVCFLPWTFAATLGLYCAVTLTYSFWLKSKLLIDVITLAGLYSLRIFAGSAATETPVSQWLLAFSMFLFLSLALVKRCSEIGRLVRESKQTMAGRGYYVADLQILQILGCTSGLVAVVVFALYLNSAAMLRLYPNILPLWLICPLLLYWIMRIWMLAARGRLSEDPVVFAVKDRVSYLVFFCAVLLTIAAALFAPWQLPIALHGSDEQGGAPTVSPKSTEVTP